MPSAASLEFVYHDLLAAYRQAAQDIEDEQAALINDPRRASRRARLSAMRHSIDESMTALEKATLRWAERDFPVAYGLGGRFGAAEVGRTFEWDKKHRTAVQSAAERVYGDLLTGTKGVRASTKTLINQIHRDALLQKLIKGETATKAGRQMAALLHEHGITAIVYGDGSRRGLAEYSQMTMRTSSALSYNHATITASADGGCKFWEIFDGIGCGLDRHDGLPKANGLIVDESGAFSNPLSHPQCTRAFGPRPELQTRKAAVAAGLV